MPTNTIIEPYTDVHKHEVAKLILAIQNTEFGIPITLDSQPDLNKIPQFYQINRGNFWIARMDNEMIGTISLLDIGNHQGALRKMFVHKNYRGREMGVGQKLLETLLEWAREKSFTELFLGTTAHFVGAQKFYEKNGFRKIGKEQLPANFPIMEVDTVFYQFSL